MYQTSIEGIRSVMKECWNIYESTDNNFQKLGALKLAKECHEAGFKLVDEGPKRNVSKAVAGEVDSD